MFEKIQSYLAGQLDISPDEITRETTFESLGIDSLDTVEMVMDLEDAFNVTIDITKVKGTVGDLIKVIEEEANK